MNKIFKIKTLSFIILVFLFILSTGSPPTHAIDKIEEAKKSVAKIIIYKNGSTETGAGIITLFKKDEINIITTYKVIKNADSVYVEFYKHPTNLMKGKIFHKFHEEYNLTLITVKSDEIPKDLKLPRIGDISKLRELDNVLFIGHPAGKEWTITKGENQKSQNPSFLLFLSEAVAPGSYGGALLNEQYELIGLVTEKDLVYGLATNINDIVTILENWGITPELKQEKRKWKWLVTGGVVTGVIAAALLISKEDGSKVAPDKFPLPIGRPHGD